MRSFLYGPIQKYCKFFLNIYIYFFVTLGLQSRIDFLNNDQKMCLSNNIELLPIRWTIQFCEENYSDNLFEGCKSLVNDWKQVSMEECDEYKPQIRKSMCVNQIVMTKSIPDLQAQEYDWKQYDLFSTNVTEDISTTFCGGPICALAWAPTPLNLVVDQYLAVCVQKDFDTTCKVGQMYTGKHLIQFWNFGPLQNNVALEQGATLEFCLAHDHGMVWSMEWCPSGCYNKIDDETGQRLGLLALACSDGLIVIYSICFPNILNKSGTNNIYKTKEQYKLIMETEQKLGGWDYQATKLSWTKAKNHRTIAGSYSNGVVCLWDLETESPLLKSKEDNGTIILRPYLSFQPHCGPVTALVLHPLDGGNRWLFTGSWDRNNHFWDLQDVSTPEFSGVKKSLISDGVWLTHWLSAITTYDDVCSLARTTTTIQNPRDYNYKQLTTLATNSMINNISGSDWTNGVVQVSTAGELTAIFPWQLLDQPDFEKLLLQRRLMFGYNELIEKNLEPAKRVEKCSKKKEKKDTDFTGKDEKFIFDYFKDKVLETFEPEPSTYEEAQNKYGLVFCDFNLSSLDKIPMEALVAVKKSERMREAPVELYPLLSINRVQWNPNQQAYHYIATGYQTGFIRIKCVRYLNK